MNIFRLTGDLTHLVAIIILLLKIWKTRSCSGISGKSQVLFGLVYITRYLDLFTNFISLYNSFMKVVFISAQLATLYLMYGKFKATYDRNHDTFRIEFLLIPVTIFALLVNHEFTPLEVLWTFSIYLEAVAILPQLFLVSKTGETDTKIWHYLMALFSYRALYLFNWIWRYYMEGFYDLIAIVAGVVQTLIFCDFFAASLLSTIILWFTDDSRRLPPAVKSTDKSNMLCSVLMEKPLISEIKTIPVEFDNLLAPNKELILDVTATGSPFADIIHK